ncbi:MAG: SBBP repeat-containing protein, partial [Acidobacteriota bacterium]
MPMAFEKNLGQTIEQVKFFARGPGYGVFLTATEAVFELNEPNRESKNRDSHSLRPADRRDDVLSSGIMRMKLVGADAPQAVEGLEQLPGKSHYFKGSDSNRWRTDVATYAKVKYSDVYPGVDLVYHGTQSQLEYDFVVAPGADPERIRLRFDGLTDTSIGSNGDLILRLGERELRERSPVIYQEVHGRHHAISGGYAQTGKNEITFQVGRYDKQETLIIDPVIVYSTYLGGTGYDDSSGIGVGSDGSIYVAGTTASVDFPTVNPVQPSNAGQPDVYVAKISADGSALEFATYFGGGGADAT